MMGASKPEIQQVLNRINQRKNVLSLIKQHEDKQKQEKDTKSPPSHQAMVDLLHFFSPLNEGEKKVLLAKFEVDPEFTTYEALNKIAGHLQDFLSQKETFRGEDGKDGYTPQRGKDYMTEEDKRQIAEMIQHIPVKGKDYFTYEDRRQFLEEATPKKGIHYRDGVDGRNGKDGKNGRNGKDGISAPILTPKQMKDMVLSALGLEKMPLKFLDGAVSKEEMENYAKDRKLVTKSDLEQRLNMFRVGLNDPSNGDQRWHGGGQKLTYYDLSDQLNGSTKSFTIPANKMILAINSSSTPFVFRPTVDYTGSGTTTLTFTAGIDAPSMLASGQTLIITYVQ